MKTLLATWLLLGALVMPAWAAPVAPRQPLTEQQKIAYLITSVADLHDAAFIRNGKSYDAQQAAAHLRLKLRFAGDRAATAEGFIACCATRSSMSGIKYTIRFSDGRVVDAATYLHNRLAAYEQANAGDHKH